MPAKITVTRRNAIGAGASKSETPGHLSEHTALHQRVIQWISGVGKLFVPGSQKILAHHAYFDELPHSPTDAAVHPRIGGYISIRQLTDISDSVIPFEMVRKVEQRSHLKLVIRGNPPP